MTDQTLMPFGKKYKDKPLKDIPVSYLIWMRDEIKNGKSRIHMNLSEKQFIKYVDNLPKEACLPESVTYHKKSKILKPKWLTDPSYMRELGYELISEEKGYYKFSSIGNMTVNSDIKGTEYILAKGKRVLSFNATYAPENKLIAFGVRDDWDTRNSFNGVVSSFTDVKHILKLVR